MNSRPGSAFGLAESRPTSCFVTLPDVKATRRSGDCMASPAERPIHLPILFLQIFSRHFLGAFSCHFDRVGNRVGDAAFVHHAQTGGSGSAGRYHHFN